MSEGGNGGLWAVLGAVASVLAILTFVTGRDSLEAFLDGDDERPATVVDRPDSSDQGGGERPPDGPEVTPEAPATTELDVSGFWSGGLTQVDDFGVLIGTWAMTLDLEQDGSILTGELTLSDQLGGLAVFRVEGFIDDGIIVLDDTELLESVPVTAFWCIKRTELQAGTSALLGGWQSTTFGCVGGAVELRR